MSKKNYIIPIFVPHKGCPYNCVFCNQNRITGQVKEPMAEDIHNIVNKHLQTIKKDNTNIEIAFFGGSFTAIPEEEQNIYLHAANYYLKKGEINSIRLSTRPDYIDKKIIMNLKNMGVEIVELGVQTMDEDILYRSQRGHSVLDSIKAIRLLKEEGFVVGAQLMVGLPGDNKEKALKTAKRIAELRPDFVRIYPAVIIKDTHMEHMYERGEYKPFDLKTTVDICKEMLIILERDLIPVIRIGLQATDEIQIGKSIIAGPYHPSFRQLVETEIYKDMIAFILDSDEINESSEISIFYNDKDCSNVVGHKSSNKIFFKNKYRDNKINFNVENIERNSICIIIDNKRYSLSKNEYYNKLLDISM